VGGSFSGIRKQVTEHGSMTSENSHLSGGSDIARDHVVQEFCIKNADTEDSESEDDDDKDDDSDAEGKDTYFMEGKGCFR